MVTYHNTYIYHPLCNCWIIFISLNCVFIQANYLLRCPSAPVEVTCANETIYALVVVRHLTEAALGDENLKPFAILANKCVDPIFRDRPNARDLLNFIDREL